MIFGIMIFAFGIAERVENRFQQISPIYRSVDMQRHRFLQNKEKGWLVGVVIAKENDTLFSFEDIDHERWKVHMNNAQVMHNAIIEKGSRLKLQGNIRNTHTVEAKIIYPWMRKRMILKENIEHVRNTR